MERLRAGLVKTDDPPAGQVFNRFPDGFTRYTEFIGKGADRYVPIPLAYALHNQLLKLTKTLSRDSGRDCGSACVAVHEKNPGLVQYVLCGSNFQTLPLPGTISSRPPLRQPIRAATRG
jgi:hypothetical protein